MREEKERKGSRYNTGGVVSEGRPVQHDEIKSPPLLRALEPGFPRARPVAVGAGWAVHASQVDLAGGATADESCEVQVRGLQLRNCTPHLGKMEKHLK
ncbi:hypothetical protein GGTG_10950 [Gaeumannomyces tritici R3-111a-1]|uniref:Uncharacterized protein n=1 Tax=Gaeumannomyces tritici (strain R3-111a-1) TaxID=644352 RepID=J3PBS9_GAET3|nr:hypothetical protein GGTG_10950 [Gaeumannomyces tritici R3-111a-1]EJT71696.1 hypothetical protein GGTG_10950 [Gaeumannomyces tritici R3-111a-1]